MLLGAAKGQLRDGGLTLFGPLEEELQRSSLERARLALGDNGFRATLARGASMSVDAAVGLACAMRSTFRKASGRDAVSVWCGAPMLHLSASGDVSSLQTTTEVEHADELGARRLGTGLERGCDSASPRSTSHFRPHWPLAGGSDLGTSPANGDGLALASDLPSEEPQARGERAGLAAALEHHSSVRVEYSQARPNGRAWLSPRHASTGGARRDRADAGSLAVAALAPPGSGRPGTGRPQSSG